VCVKKDLVKSGLYREWLLIELGDRVSFAETVSVYRPSMDNGRVTEMMITM